MAAPGFLRQGAHNGRALRYNSLRSRRKNQGPASGDSSRQFRRFVKRISDAAGGRSLLEIASRFGKAEGDSGGMTRASVLGNCHAVP